MRTYDQLQSQTRPTGNLLREHPEADLKVWTNLIKKEMELGDQLYSKGQLDDSYLKYFFVVQMMLEVLPKHKQFTPSNPHYQQLRVRLGVIVTRLEQIKLKLKGAGNEEAGTSSNDNQTDTTQQIASTSASQAFNSAVSSKFPSLASGGASSGPSPLSKTPSSTPSSTPSPQLSGISAVEIQTLLANSTPKILFIDIRPMEEFIQGHISWRSQQSAPNAGLISIEPDWLKDGVTASDLDQYLTSFGSSSNTAKLLFDARMQMDLIVFYDNDSRGMKPSSVFDYLYKALYADIRFAPKAMPKILSGGYISWNYFVTNSRDLVNLDWVEIGEGNGIKPFDNIRARGASNAPPPQSSNFSPNMRANGQQQQINSQQQPGFANTSAAYHNYYGIPSAQPLNASEGNFQKSPSGTSLNLSNNQRYPSGIAGNPAAPNLQTGNMGGGYSQQAPPQSTIVGLGLSQNNYVNQQHSSALYPNSNQQHNSQSYPTQQQRNSQVAIPQRNSSLTDDSSDRKSSVTRRALFNDPFLGKVGGLVGNGATQVNASSTNYPNTGLGAPLISLPPSQQQQQQYPHSPGQGLGGVYSTYQQPQPSSKLSSISFKDPDLPVSYPRASSRSPSPEMDSQSKGDLQFSERYPSVEALNLKMTPPSIPSKNYSSSTTAPSQQSPPVSTMYNQYLRTPIIPPIQQQGPSAPALPPKPLSSLENRVKGMSLDEMNVMLSSGGSLHNSTPTIPPKPRKLSPPLPSRPDKIETSSGLDKRGVLIRGQHPFVLPTTPIGHKFGISGLRNLGNTCFMNSILQCLSATYPFSRYFMDGSYRRHLAKNNPLSSQGKVSEGFARVVRDLWVAEESVVVPSQFKQVIGSIHPNFAGNEQQDSQEFLSFILDQLHEDLNVAKRPFPPNGPDLDSENYGEEDFMMMEWQKYRARNWSIIVDMFQGMLRSVLQCLTCGKTSTTYNMFMYLTLPIPSRNKDGVKNGPVTIFECLEAFLATEKLSGDDQWKCPRCKVNRDASKILSLVRLPTVLLIHFKRFSFQGPFRDKLETAIYYPVKRLDMSKYTKTGGDSYTLCGVSNHFGGLNGGHYTAQVKHVHNDRWFTLDDSRVSEANESDVQNNNVFIEFLNSLNLLICQCRLNGFRSCGTELVRCCIRDYMSTFYRFLNHGKKALIHATLALLATMVLHSPSTATDILAVFNFNLKPLPSFLNMRLRKNVKKSPNSSLDIDGNPISSDAVVDPTTTSTTTPTLLSSDEIVSKDIRGVYIKFLLAFLQRGDAMVKKTVLETKNLLHLIFKDIKNDSFDTVEYILSTFDHKVINDSRIPKTTKVHFFHIGILQQLVGLYGNSDPALHSSDISSTLKSDNSKTIADLVHEFFLKLCCAPSQGICFQDNGWYPASNSNTTLSAFQNSQKSQPAAAAQAISNPLLGKLLLALKISTDMLQRDLFLKVLDVCPELVHFFWTNATHLSFEPRSSIYYIANIALVTSVIQKPIPHQFMGKANTILSPPSIATTMSHILPSPLTKQISSKALQHTSRDVRFACCRQLSASFEKVDKVFQVCVETTSTLPSLDTLESWHRDSLEREWRAWRVSVLENVRARLPDPNIIILLGKSAVLPPTEMDEGEISVQDMVLAHLGLLKYYLKYHSAAVLETRYDFGKLLNGLHSKGEEGEGWSNKSLGLIVQVLGQVEGFKWWNKSEDKQTFFRILLDFYLVIADPVLKREMEGLFSQFLDATSAFQGHPDALKSFWKLVWKQGSEIAPLVESNILAFAPSAFLSNEGGLIPPIYAQMINQWKEDSPATAKVFISSLVMHDCRESGSVERCRYYLDFLKKEGSADTCVVKASLIGWLLYCLGEEEASTQSRLATLEWKKAKSMLKSNNAGDFIESLFQISPQSFLDTWEKLFKKFESFSTYINLYMQMTCGSCQGTLDATFFETPAVTDSSVLLELLFLRSLYGSTNSFQLQTRLNSEIEKISPLSKIGITHILFYVESWGMAFSKEKKKSIESSEDPLCMAFSLVYRILRGNPKLAEKTLENPILLAHFLPLEKDKTHRDQVYEAVLNVLNIECSSKAIYRKKFIEHITANSPKRNLSPFTSKTFQILADSFQVFELDLIANVLLESKKRNSVMNEILWYCISVNPAAGNSKTFVEALIQQLEVEEVFPINLLGLLKQKTGLYCAEILGLIDFSLFERLLQKRSSDMWDFVCWICGRSVGHAMWLVDIVKSEKVDSLSKKEKLQLLKALAKKLFCQSSGKWRDQIPKSFWKFIKSLCKSTIEIQADIISQALIGSASSFKAVDADDAWLIVATFEVHGFEIAGQIASSLDSRLKMEIADLPLSVSSLLSSFRVLVSVGHALSTSLTTFAVWLICSYYRRQKRNEIESVDEKSLNDNVVKLMSIIAKTNLVKLGNADIYRSFIAAILKYQITSRACMSFLQVSLHHNGSLVPPYEVLEMITTHSMFNTLIESVAEENKTIPVTHDCKSSLLRVIYELIKLDPVACCKIDLARKLALNYYGTTSESDVASLKIFHHFEQVAHISMSDFLSGWGNQVDSKISCFAESLGAIDNIWMANTIHWFSLEKDIDIVSEETPLSSPRIFSSKCQPCYDPSFFLPLAAAALADKNTPVDVHRLLESNLIGLAVMALSSSSLHTRQIGHFVIYNYYEALKESSVKEKNQVILLLDSLRNSMVSTPEEAFPVISGIIASFSAQGLMILMKPESDMYPLVNRFCLQRDQIDLFDIPMFYDLFYSTNEDCRKERIWMLRLISNGIKSKLDFQLLARRHVFSIMIAFFNSPIADTITRKLIIEILFKVSMIPSAVSNLITKSGLMSFLKTLCSTLSFTSSNDLSLAIPEFLHAVVTGYLKSPTAWDGKLSRQDWVAQSLDVLHLLLATLGTLSFSKEAWATTFALRTLKVCKCIVVATKETGPSLSLEHLQILRKVLSNYSSSPAPLEVQAEELNASILPWSLNLDSLFLEDAGSPYKLHIAKQCFADILLASSYSSGVLVSVDLVLWSLDEKESHLQNWTRELLVWLLKLLVRNGMHLGISDSERKRLLHFLYQCHFADNATDLEMQLVRACLVVLHRDADGGRDVGKLGKRKRLLNDDDGDSSASLQETIAQHVHLTLSPKYLLSILHSLEAAGSHHEEDYDSFQQVVFGELLLDNHQEALVSNLLKNLGS